MFAVSPPVEVQNVCFLGGTKCACRLSATKCRVTCPWKMTQVRKNISNNFNFTWSHWKAHVATPLKDTDRGCDFRILIRNLWRSQYWHLITRSIFQAHTIVKSYWGVCMCVFITLFPGRHWAGACSWCSEWLRAQPCPDTHFLCHAAQPLTGTSSNKPHPFESRAGPK